MNILLPNVQNPWYLDRTKKKNDLTLLTRSAFMHAAKTVCLQNKSA